MILPVKKKKDGSKTHELHILDTFIFTPKRLLYVKLTLSTNCLSVQSLGRAYKNNKIKTKWTQKKNFQ